MKQPATPLPASTVVLVRRDESGQGFEIFMNRRPSAMDTYAGIYVFPGGRVENADCTPEMLRVTLGLTPTEAQQKLGGDLQPELCFGHWVAAARELFEEAGILLFASQTAELSHPAQEKMAERLAAKRSELQQGAIDFASLLAGERLFCDLACLTYFFHRVTPEHYPVRFDTRFYLAALPARQYPLHCSEEVSESLWITANEALERSGSGNFPMMPPTVAVLRTLAEHGSWDKLREAFFLR
jgi:8-oxo-dGTP pyrophosphatase MutT (NUDIX family)